MPVLESCNHAIRDLVSPVVSGGTNGIGAALARLLARNSSGTPRIHLLGRSQSAADAVITSMSSANPKGQYRFHQCDLSLFSSVKSVAQEIRESCPKINFLIMTQGILTTQGRTETSEGNDVKMMLHIYGRMALAHALIASLEAAASDNEPARILSVLDATRGNPAGLHRTDLDLRKNYSLSAAANHCITMTDIAVQSGAKSHPSVAWIHAYPGTVKTELNKGLPTVVRYMTIPIFKVLGETPENCATYLSQAIMSPDYATGSHFIDNHGDPVKNKKVADESLAKEVNDHIKAMLSPYVEVA